MAIMDEILSEVDHIAPLPQSARQLMCLAGKESHSLPDIARVVECDAALTANVLKVVNSAFFRPVQPVSSLPMAITLLGEKLVIGIAIGTCCHDFFDKPLEGYESPRGELWKQSLRTAIFARELSVHSAHGVNRELAYTAGLLHGIGKSVLSHHLQGKTEELVKRTSGASQLDFLAAERELLGVDHCQVGHALAMKWNLPEELGESIRCYSDPDQADAAFRPLVYCVHAGNVLAMMAGDEQGADSLRYKLSPNYAEYLSGLTTELLDQIVLRAQDEFSKATSAFANGL